MSDWIDYNIDWDDSWEYTPEEELFLDDEGYYDSDEYLDWLRRCYDDSELNWTEA